MRELIREEIAGTEAGRLERGWGDRGEGGWSIVLFMSNIKRIRRSKQDACEGPGTLFACVSIFLGSKIKGNVQPCVVMTPPSRRASWSSLK